MPARIARRKQIKIFLVEDSAAVVQRLEDLVKELPGIELVGNAGDVIGAIRSILELRPDAVVLDLQLHNGNGLDVLRVVKSTRPETVVVIVTNSSDRSYRERCLREGASFFLDKSMEFEKIPEILTSLTTARAAS
jgi:DNA-binding NarL/FixJ family response regulator